MRLNVSVTKSAAPKAAEKDSRAKTCRNLRGAKPREAYGVRPACRRCWTDLPPLCPKAGASSVLLPLLSRRLSATDSSNHPVVLGVGRSRRAQLEHSIETLRGNRRSGHRRRWTSVQPIKRLVVGSLH